MEPRGELFRSGGNLTKEQRKRLLIFHPALAPYRVDQFNGIARLFDLHIVFLFDNVWNHPFDQANLLSRSNFSYSYLLSGPRWKSRVFRFGMLREIRRFNPDVVFGYEFSFTTLYLLLLARLNLFKGRLGSTIDDSPEMCQNIQTPMRAFARRIVIPRLDYIAVFSSAVSQFFAKNFSISQDQIIVSPLVQDPKHLRANADDLDERAETLIETHKLHNKKVLLFVGRLVDEKGLIPYIEGISDVLHSTPEAVLILVGDGPLRSSIEQKIHELELDSSVLLPGRFEGPDLYAWYLCASGFVLPSLFEPFGAVVDEAQVFGLPVLCSRFAGSSVLVTPDKGMIFDPSDPAKATSDFLEGIPLPLPKLASRPSQSSFHEDTFNEQWKKIITFSNPGSSH